MGMRARGYRTHERIRTLLRNSIDTLRYVIHYECIKSTYERKTLNSLSSRITIRKNRKIKGETERPRLVQRERHTSWGESVSHRQKEVRLIGYV